MSASYKPRPAKWKREGYQNEAEYRGACAATRRTKAASLLASKVKNTRALVFEKMWARADFHQPLVTVTKENMMSDCRCSLETVIYAWRELKAEGSIKPIRNRLGGRGNAVTFRLGVAGIGDTPIQQYQNILQNERDREAAFRFLAQKFGGLKAIEIMQERGEPIPEGVGTAKSGGEDE